MAYSKKANKDAVHEEKEHPYELIIIDADTPVFRASKFVQEDYVNVTHIKSGKVQEFKTKSEFHGRDKLMTGGWLGDINAKRIEEGKNLIPVTSFTIEPHTRLLDDIEDHITEGLKTFDFFIGNIKGMDLAPTYKLLVGSSDNFRYDVAQTTAYKGQRPEKPLLFNEIKDAILAKYGKYIEVVEGKEVDDEMAVYGAYNLEQFKETGAYPYILSYIDKDLNMIQGPHNNYDKPNDPVEVSDEFEAMAFYCKQLLCGDKSVDQIMGLPNLEPHLRERHGVRKGVTVGDATAINYLKSSETIKEMFERVVEAYIAHYGTDQFEKESFRGVTYTTSWLGELQEVAMLIFMNDLENPLDYHIGQHLDKYEVDVNSIEEQYRDD